MLRLSAIIPFHERDERKQSAPMAEAVAVADIAAFAGLGTVVFVHMAMAAPSLEDQPFTLLCQLAAGYTSLVAAMTAQRQIHQKIHRRPDATPPVILIRIGGVTAGNGWQPPLAAEFRRVVQVFFDHSVKLTDVGDLRQNARMP